MVPDSAGRARPPDAVEIVVPGGQEARTTAPSIPTEAAPVRWGLTLTGDYRHDEEPADLPDRLHQPRPLQVPGVWNFQDFLKVGAVFRDGCRRRHRQIGYSAKVREFVADVEVSLFKNMLTLRGAGGGSRSTGRS
jgi:hypothetical protein